MKKTSFFLLFFLFILTLYPSLTTNVRGATSYYSYGMEYTTATHQVAESDYGNGFFYTAKRTYDAFVDTTYAYEGSKSYQVGNTVAGTGGTAWFNSTLGSGIALLNFSCWFYLETGASGNVGQKTSYWNIKDYDGIQLAYLHTRSINNPGAVEFSYTDHNDVEQVLDASLVDDTWHFLYMYYTDNDTMTIGIYDGNSGITTEAKDIQPLNVVDVPKWNCTIVGATAYLDIEKMWVDNWNITLTTDFEGLEGETDLSDYNHICNGGTSYIQILNSRYVEDQYPLKLTTTIVAVELFISNDQYNQVSGSVSNYYCYVNGLSIGNADEMDQYSTYGYKLRWLNLNVALSDEYPTFEFYCNAYTYSGGTKVYWKGLGVNTEGGLYRYHNTATKYGNGVYDGTSSNFGLNMCFYFAGVETQPPEYADIDEIHPVSDQGNIYTEWQTVMFGYTISLPSPNTYIRLYKSGVKVTAQGYDTKLAHYSTGSCSLALYTGYAGSYSIQLNRSGVTLDWYNFTVVSLPNDYDYNAQIMTHPKPSGDGKPFTVAWLYNYTYFDSKNAYVLRSDYDYLETGHYVVIKSVIKNNGNTTDTITLDKTRQYPQTLWYYHLCNLLNGSYYSLVSCPHWVGEFTKNELYSDASEYRIKDQPGFNYKFANVRLYGSHSFVGSDAYVLINDGSVLRHYVGGNSAIDLEIPITEPGFYKAELVKYISNETYKVYRTVNFTVVNEYGVLPEPTYADIIDEYIPNEDLQGILGLAIIITSLVMPIYINYEWNRQFKADYHFPEFLYYITFTTGLAITIWLELLWLWLMVIFVFIDTTLIIAKILNSEFAMQHGFNISTRKTESIKSEKPVTQKIKDAVKRNNNSGD